MGQAGVQKLKASQVTVEPRVEDLLATIRKAIDDDLNGLDAAATTSGNSKGKLLRGALREMRVNYEPEAPDPQHPEPGSQLSCHLRPRRLVTHAAVQHKDRGAGAVLRDNHVDTVTGPDRHAPSLRSRSDGMRAEGGVRVGSGARARRHLRTGG